MLFKENEEKTTDKDKERAVKLLELLLKKKRVAIRPKNMNRWAASIRLIYSGKTPVATEHQVDCVLAWLESGIDSRWCPVIFSAMSFRQKFPQLLLAMKRDKADTIEVSDEAVDVAARLKARRKFTTPIEAMIQRQLNFIKAFRVACLVNSNTSVSHRILGNIGEPKSYVRIWMENAHDSLHSTGMSPTRRIENLELTPDNGGFRSLVSSWCAQSGHPEPQRMAAKLMEATRKALSDEG